ncbi:cysteine methyltransferase [bacterium endosymbiont of Escarpia laminata]|nr:MAG: cysteine methyltransferase [bacterium endosymbiont of Escarpia laminata]
MSQQHREFQAIFPVPFGALGVVMRGETLHQIDFLPQNTSSKPPSDDVSRNVVSQIQHYLVDSKRLFTLPLQLHGTDFQQRVWTELQTIPSGEVRTYGEVAKRLNSSPRAVGNACRANPCPVVVPCHRVVGANGIGGFSGERKGGPLAIKRWLLNHEGWSGCN